MRIVRPWTAQFWFHPEIPPSAHLKLRMDGHDRPKCVFIRVFLICMWQTWKNAYKPREIFLSVSSLFLCLIHLYGSVCKWKRIIDPWRTSVHLSAFCLSTKEPFWTKIGTANLYDLCTRQYQFYLPPPKSVLDQFLPFTLMGSIPASAFLFFVNNFPLQGEKGVFATMGSITDKDIANWLLQFAGVLHVAK